MPSSVKVMKLCRLRLNRASSIMSILSNSDEWQQLTNLAKGFLVLWWLLTIFNVDLLQDDFEADECNQCRRTERYNKIWQHWSNVVPYPAIWKVFRPSIVECHNSELNFTSYLCHPILCKNIWSQSPLLSNRSPCCAAEKVMRNTICPNDAISEMTPTLATLIS